MVTTYSHSIENSLKVYRPPQSSFHDRTNRFEEYASTKKTPPGRNYTYKLSNVGPGAYDVHPASRAGEAIVRARTATLYNNERISHLDESYWPKRAGAPVGTYNVNTSIHLENSFYMTITFQFPCTTLSFPVVTERYESRIYDRDIQQTLIIIHVKRQSKAENVRCRIVPNKTRMG